MCDRGRIFVFEPRSLVSYTGYRSGAENLGMVLEICGVIRSVSIHPCPAPWLKHQNEPEIRRTPSMCTMLSRPTFMCSKHAHKSITRKVCAAHSRRCGLPAPHIVLYIVLLRYMSSRSGQKLKNSRSTANWHLPCSTRHSDRANYRQLPWTSTRGTLYYFRTTLYAAG